MTEIADLKPCPFCGGTDLASRGDDKIVAVCCNTCEATGPNEYSSQHDWNRRAAITIKRVERKPLQFDGEANG